VLRVALIVARKHGYSWEISQPMQAAVSVKSLVESGCEAVVPSRNEKVVRSISRGGPVRSEQSGCSRIVGGPLGRSSECWSPRTRSHLRRQPSVLQMPIGDEERDHARIQVPGAHTSWRAGEVERSGWCDAESGIDGRREVGIG
jgi:hypothetical protein